MAFVSSCYILFCLVWLLSFRSLFSNKSPKRSGSRGEDTGEELGGVKGRETVNRIYCMRKESIFN